MFSFAGQAIPATANEVEIVNTRAVCEHRICHFDVTLLHEDSGWDHYADFWRVITEDGQELGRRILLHPHENEQPFTRSLGGVAIPDGINTVWIEAHDSEHGTAAERFSIDLQP